eukprot:scaffold333791_cov28-Attheya_sp.AAC.1
MGLKQVCVVARVTFEGHVVPEVMTDLVQKEMGGVRHIVGIERDFNGKMSFDLEFDVMGRSAKVS